MEKINVFSTRKMTAQDLQKIRYIMKKGQNVETHLHNTFPGEYTDKDSYNLFFGKGARRYCETIQWGGADDDN